MRFQSIVAAALAFGTLMPAAAFAQSGRVEVSGIVGWTVSDGIAGDGVPALDGNIYNAIDVKDGFSWGFGVGFNVTPKAEVGFLFNQQMSKLGVEGTRDVEIGDMNVTSYHPYFAYNLGDEDAKLRPYVMVGIGATNYASVPFSRPGFDGETGSSTRFSTTWGAGIKYFASPNVGIRAGMAWTPTYITTNDAGWWCDPYWGCYLVGDAKYSNQFHFNGGIIFRF